MVNALIRVVRNCVCLVAGHRWTVDPLSAEHVCVRCGTVKRTPALVVSVRDLNPKAGTQWPEHIKLAIADLRENQNRSPFEQRAYDVLRSMFGTDMAQK